MAAETWRGALKRDVGVAGIVYEGEARVRPVLRKPFTPGVRDGLDGPGGCIEPSGGLRRECHIHADTDGLDRGGQR